MRYSVRLAGVLAAIAIAMGGGSATADPRGTLEFTKDCTMFSGKPGGFCTIRSPNNDALKIGIADGSKIIYDLGLGAISGLIDSDVVLDAGDGNRARGHCTFDYATTNTGLCTFDDGTGKFAGFLARLGISTPNPTTAPLEYSLVGPYTFTYPHNTQNNQ